MSQDEIDALTQKQIDKVFAQATPKLRNLMCQYPNGVPGLINDEKSSVAKKLIEKAKLSPFMARKMAWDYVAELLEQERPGVRVEQVMQPTMPKGVDMSFAPESGREV